jgi:hypothetical protein
MELSGLSTGCLGFEVLLMVAVVFVVNMLSAAVALLSAGSTAVLGIDSPNKNPGALLTSSLPPWHSSYVTRFVLGECTSEVYLLAICY